MKKVLILCSENSCRAVLAEAVINQFLNPDIKAYNAVVGSTKQISNTIFEILKEMNIDHSKLIPNKLEDIVDENFDLIVTLCDHQKESCPVFPRAIRTLHVSFEGLFNFDSQNSEDCKKTIDILKEKLLPIIKNELTE